MDTNEMNLEEILVSGEELDSAGMNDYIKEYILVMPKDELSKCIYDKKSFQSGINKVSELCGAITALVNVGINPSKAMNYLVEKDSTELMLENSIQIAKIQADATIKSSKNESVNFQKNIF